MKRIAAAAVAIVLVGAGVAGVACGSPSPPASSARDPGAGTVTDADTRHGVAWITTLDRGHPLVGRIWSVRAGAYVDEAQMLRGLDGYVLLGEKHDNPDHHVLQARVLRAMVAAGRRPVVAFEMFDVDDQDAITSARREHPHDAASLAHAAHWEKSGWPPWSDYAPIAQIALDAELPIVATGLPRERMRALMAPAHPPAGATDAGADAATPAPIDEGSPLDAEQEASLRDELRESHCGHLPDSRIGAMIRFQRARDAAMASALIAAANRAPPGDGVLIAGTGHTRLDRGAGRDLAVRDPKRPITSIAFTEVEAGKTDPGAYASRWNTTVLPFDFVWFTPRATDEDPCAAFAH